MAVEEVTMSAVIVSVQKETVDPLKMLSLTIVG